LSNASHAAASRRHRWRRTPETQAIAIHGLDVSGVRGKRMVGRRSRPTCDASTGSFVSFV
jgi:hypothetical protein